MTIKLQQFHAIDAAKKLARHDLDFPSVAMREIGADKELSAAQTQKRKSSEKGSSKANSTGSKNR